MSRRTTAAGLAGSQGGASRDEAAHRIRRHLEGVLGTPATEGNQIDVLRNGDEIFPAMFEAVEAAERTIDFLTFVYWEGDVGREAAAGRAGGSARQRQLPLRATLRFTSPRRRRLGKPGGTSSRSSSATRSSATAKS